MKFQKLLNKLASFSTHHQHKMSCIIVNKNRVVSAGYNQIKTHTKSQGPYNMLHAEVSALISMPYNDTKGCTAYIYRANRLGILSNAKPCQSCSIALKMAGIKKIIFTDQNTWKEERLV